MSLLNSNFVKGAALLFGGPRAYAQLSALSQDEEQRKRQAQQEQAQSSALDSYYNTRGAQTQVAQGANLLGGKSLLPINRRKLLAPETFAGRQMRDADPSTAFAGALDAMAPDPGFSGVLKEGDVAYLRGRPVALNPKPRDGANPTTAMQNAQAMGLAPGSPEFNEYVRRVTEPKGTTVNVNNGGVNLSPGQEAVDKKFAEQYANWITGGASDVKKNLGQLDFVLNQLRSGKNLTGLDVAAMGSMGDIALALYNDEAVNVREQVEEVVQRNLKEILGAQFTEKEGERLIARAYNPRLSESVNARRVQALFDQMQEAAEAKTAAAQYFEANKTLAGYEGSAFANFSEFEDAYDARLEELKLDDPGESDGPPDGISTDLWQEMTAEEKALWQ